MDIGFDVISDLYLTADDDFNWEGRATSLYCLVAGNVSSDTATIKRTLTHLAQFYQGVFYTSGTLEYRDSASIIERTRELHNLCLTIRNVVSLHNNVVLIDNTAVLGSNGWYTNPQFNEPEKNFEIEYQRHDDIVYMASTLARLQLYLDIKNVIIVTNSVPGPELFFGQESQELRDLLHPSTVLYKDSEKKVSHWVYGSYGKRVDATIAGINFISNPFTRTEPYWPLRIDIKT